MNRLRIHGEPMDPDRPPSGSVDTADQLVPVHPVTRGAAFVLGVLSMVCGAMIIVYQVTNLFTLGWSEFLSLLPIAAVFACSCIMLGRTFLRGAISGVEPDSEDHAIEAAESRAFLAAVEKYDATSETPPGHAPPGSV